MIALEELLMLMSITHPLQIFLGHISHQIWVSVQHRDTKLLAGLIVGA